MVLGLMYAVYAADFHRPTRAICAFDAPDCARSLVLPILKECVLYFSGSLWRSVSMELRVSDMVNRDRGSLFS